MNKARQCGEGVPEHYINQYLQQGFCLLEGLIPSALIEAAWQRVQEIIDHPPDWPSGHFQVLDPAEYCSASGDPLPKGMQRPGLEESVFAAVAEHPNLSQAMAALLGGEVELFTDQIGVKHGRIQTEQGGRSFFHQDSWYWKIEPQLGCNCWIPMHKVGEDAIALSVMPGSHTNWVLTPHESYYDDPPMFSRSPKGGYVPFNRHRIPLDQIDPTREMLVEMAAGDGLFFSNYTWHRSEPNRTGETMAFYAIAYQRRSDR